MSLDVAAKLNGEDVDDDYNEEGGNPKETKNNQDEDLSSRKQDKIGWLLVTLHLHYLIHLEKILEKYCPLHHQIQK